MTSLEGRPFSPSSRFFSTKNKGRVLDPCLGAGEYSFCNTEKLRGGALDFRYGVQKFPVFHHGEMQVGFQGDLPDGRFPH